MFVWIAPDSFRMVRALKLLDPKMIPRHQWPYLRGLCLSEYSCNPSRHTRRHVSHVFLYNSNRGAGTTAHELTHAWWHIIRCSLTQRQRWELLEGAARATRLEERTCDLMENLERNFWRAYYKAGGK